MHDHGAMLEVVKKEWSQGPEQGGAVRIVYDASLPIDEWDGTKQPSQHQAGLVKSERDGGSDADR